MTASPTKPAWTNSGIPAQSDKDSPGVGPDGPILAFQPGTRADANAESRSALARLAEEQEALKRVAILVARGTPAEQVFAAVTEEVGRLLPVDMTNMCRYEPGNTMTFVATWTKGDEGFRLGSRWPLGGQNLATLVFETGRSVRIDNYADASGPLSVAAQDTGIRSAVASPIIVEGRLWGMMGAGSSAEQTLPRYSEARLASFTELVAMAIANAESRAELKASRARIIAATDETRLRIERDLHDGIQQQLVSLLLELRSAQAAVPAEMEELRAHHARMERGLDSVLTELQEISRGIHPAILTKAGLGPALKTLARRSALPVELELPHKRRWPEHVEVAAYYVVSEALTNAAKHAHASVVQIDVAEQDAILTLAIRDDGVGGADPVRGQDWRGWPIASKRWAADSRSLARREAEPRFRSRSRSKDKVPRPSPDLSCRFRFFRRGVGPAGGDFDTR